MAKKKKSKPSKWRGWLISPQQVERWLDLAADQLAAEKYTGVVRTCRRVLRYVPPNVKQRAQALDYLSIALMMQQEFADAYAALSEAVTITPDNAYLWYNRGLASLYTMRYGRSVLDLERAVALETEPDLIADYTAVLADARLMAEHERALRGPDFTLEALIEQEELYQQGVRLMSAGHWAEAGQVFRQVIELGDCLPQPWGNLGACLLMEQQYDAGEAALRRALEIQPDYRLAQTNLQILAQVRVSGQLPEKILVSQPFKERKPNISIKFHE
ncbi:MAG: hypothetical protein AB1801_29685 [Chloroflexota bacterium]